MLRAVARCCGHWPPGAAAADGMLWQTELRPHAAGEFSMAAAQANVAMEDQAQVLASPAATLVGVYDGHGGPDASRFLRSRLFPHVQRCAKEQGGMSTEAIRRAFGTAEEEFHQQVRQAWLKRPRMAAVGSCCLLGAISGDTLYVANLGDSRAVLGRRAVGGGVAGERGSSKGRRGNRIKTWTRSTGSRASPPTSGSMRRSSATSTICRGWGWKRWRRRAPGTGRGPAGP